VALQVALRAVLQVVAVEAAVAAVLAQCRSSLAHRECQLLPAWLSTRVSCSLASPMASHGARAASGSFLNGVAQVITGAADYREARVEVVVAVAAAVIAALRMGVKLRPCK
jgi:hypothetical protein